MPISSIKNFIEVSGHTASDWCKHPRYPLGDSLLNSDVKIGGPSIIVEIDETKMGKRKYNKGHRVESIWCVAARKSEVMYKIIEEYVIPESKIHTDCWKSYIQPLRELGFEQKTVNHTLFFKEPKTGVHTNTIKGVELENEKFTLKYFYLVFIWRRKHKNDLWSGFIKALKEIKC